jgi:beta-aspartyl-peptidase (threonine type)
VSGTGHGEVFIRFAASQEISARMRLAGQSLEQAARSVVMNVLAPNDGSGGVIAVDKDGNYSLPFNCAGMYRGVVTQDGALRTAIYEEPLVERKL